jgi:hypothetical protein
MQNRSRTSLGPVAVDAARFAVLTFANISLPSAPLVHIEGGCGSLFVGECSAEFRFDPPTVWLLEA